jgi:uncharacterized protein with NAD-binding domain and iron-sulfur cluster
MFHKSRLLENRNRKGLEPFDNRTEQQDRKLKNSGPSASEGGSYIELVVSASKNLIDKSRTEIVDLALKEVREFFPEARHANLLKSTVIKEVHATYSPRPGIDAYRPQQATVWPRVFLAGDWTATGWSATMEGAVRSGYLAAETLTRSAGVNHSPFLASGLRASSLIGSLK